MNIGERQEGPEGFLSLFHFSKSLLEFSPIRGMSAIKNRKVSKLS